MDSKFISRCHQALYFVAYRLLLFYWFLFRPKVRGVNVAIWFKDKILLVRPCYKNVYSLPGGYVKRGEDRKTAAIRELEEELNLTAFRTDLKYVDTILTTNEYKYDFTSIFETRSVLEPSINIEYREIIGYELLPLETAVSRKLQETTRIYLQNVAEKRAYCDEIETFSYYSGNRNLQIFTNRKKRSGIDRRSGADRRKSGKMRNLIYIGPEKRLGGERRANSERRRNWIRCSRWSSVPIEEPYRQQIKIP